MLKIAFEGGSMKKTGFASLISGIFFLFVLVLAACSGSGGNLVGKGGGTGVTTQEVPQGPSFEGFYALTQMVVTSQSNPSVVNDQSNKGLSAFVTINADDSLSVSPQSPGCERDPSTHDCKTPVVNNPMSMSGTWQKQSDQFVVKILQTETNETLEITFKLQQEGAALIATGSQTGGAATMNLDQAGLHDGSITKMVLQKYLSDPTAADLVGTYDFVPASSTSFSNVDSQSKPLLDAGVTSAQANLDASGHFQVTETPAPSSAPPLGTYQFVDRNHLTINDGVRTQNFVYRYLRESGRLTLWNYNDTNSFGPGPSPQVSSTVQVDLMK